MAITIGAVVTGQTNGGVTTVTTASATTQSGSVVVVGCMWDSVSFNTISDSNSNAWTQIGSGSSQFETTLPGRFRVYYDENITGGSGHNFTFTTNAGSSLTNVAIELRGVPASSSLDTSAQGSIDTSSPFSHSITPSAGERMLVALYFGNGETSAPTVASPWTIPSGGSIAGDPNSWGIAVAYQSVTANGSTAYTANFSDSGATSGVVVLLSFIPGASGPTINTQPANQIAKAGSTATFTVSATASAGTLSYQWQRNTGASWANISGATSSGYTTPTLTTGEDGYLYRVNVTDSNGTVTSNSASLDVWDQVFDSAVFDSAVFDTGVAVGTKVYVKVSGAWKLATPYVKVSGTWKQATPGVKISGVWKQ